MKSRCYTLQELAEIKYGKNQKKVESDTGTIPIYGTGGLMGYATEPLYDKPSVLIGRKGTIDKVHYVEHPFWTVDTLFYTKINTDIVLPRYFYYLMKQLDLKQYNEGTTIPSLRTETLNRLEFSIPDKAEQARRLSLIVPIENKIDYNNAINQNLEEQAQAIFADWYKNNAKGARKVTLDDVCKKVTDGAHYSPQDVATSAIPMLSVKDMGKYDFNFSSCKHISDDDYQTMIANDCVPQIDDILVAKDGSYLKEIFICNEERKLAILSSIAIFRPNSSIVFPEILLAFLKSPNVLQEVRDNYVSGSALPRIVLKDFKKLSFYLPSLQDQSSIADALNSFRKSIATNIAENQRLINLRDILLPRLMSGELDVSGLAMYADKS